MEKCSKKCFEGDLIAEAGKTYDYVEITGSLDISADAKLPALTRVGGDLFISAIWCEYADHPSLSWTFRTKIPHETFTIMEDGEPYCIGIVFALKDVVIK